LFNHISTQAQKLINLTKRKHSASKTKLITITSGKGGVGKSTFTANIAYLLAKKGFSVCVLDADIGLANMQVLFDLKPKNNMFDYIGGKVILDSILLETRYENITLIAGKSGHEYANHSNSMVFSRIVEDIVNLNRFDILLVDTGAGLNKYVSEFLDVSENILAITSTDPSALTDVYALMKMLSNDKDKLMLCFNHTKNYKIGYTITDSIKKLAQKNRLNQNFMVKYLGNVSNSQNISMTGRLRKLFAKEFEGAVATEELEFIVDGLLENIK